LQNLDSKKHKLIQPRGQKVHNLADMKVEVNPEHLLNKAVDDSDRAMDISEAEAGTTQRKADTLSVPFPQ
jgi:hypothetical protein